MLTNFTTELDVSTKKFNDTLLVKYENILSIEHLLYAPHGWTTTFPHRCEVLHDCTCTLFIHSSSYPFMHWFLRSEYKFRCIMMHNVTLMSLLIHRSQDESVSLAMPADLERTSACIRWFNNLFVLQKQVFEWEPGWGHTLCTTSIVFTCILGACGWQDFRSPCCCHTLALHAKESQL